MITKHVAHLERRMAVRLLNRTTREVRPTAAGQAYYDRCLELLQAIEEAESAAGSDSAEPRGVLRVTAPVEFGNTHLAGLLAEFMRSHPDMTLLLDFNNRVVSMIEEGFDVAIRVARALDTGMIGRKLATSRFHVVASPHYLKRRGRPRDPQELAKHDCLCFAVPSPLSTWPFVNAGKHGNVKVTAKLLSTSSEALRLSAIAGSGVSLLPSFVCGEDLRRRRLVSLFADSDFGSLQIYAVYPHRRFLPARVRVFVDFLADHFGRDADADPWSPQRR